MSPIPYFTDESVAKEQGIIGQEIRMIEDNPDWQLYRTGNGNPGGTVLIEGFHHPGVELPVGVVLDHADLLADDALLLGHALAG